MELSKCLWYYHAQIDHLLPHNNGHVKSTNKTLGKKLAKIVNANKTNWDVMFYTTLWAYQIAYKVTTQYTSFEFVWHSTYHVGRVYGTYKKNQNVPQNEIDKTIQVTMEILFKLDEGH